MTRLRAMLCLPILLCGSPAVPADDANRAPGADAEYAASVLAFRDNADFRFRDRILSPLTEADRLVFDGLDYFAVAPAYALPARLEPARDTSVFAMPTFDRRTLSYSHYGTVLARLNGKELRLKAFRREDETLVRDFLLIPFRDSTNGAQTYAGGRYIEIDLPLPDRLVLDFNKATNPWCAYDPSYACPIAPVENHLPVPIPAGEKRYK